MTFRRIGRHLVFALSACLLFVSAAFAQQDVERKTVAITYPLDETVTVKFRGTTLLPRLKGEAKVKRAGRRGTRVELSIDDLRQLAQQFLEFVRRGREQRRRDLRALDRPNHAAPPPRQIEKASHLGQKPLVVERLR